MSSARKTLGQLIRQSASDYFSPLHPRSYDQRAVPSPYTTDRIRSSPDLIHKLKAKDSTGRWAYYFVLVEPDREEAFLSAIQGEGVVDLAEYGSVIASTYGEEPTPELREHLKSRYDFDV